MRILSYQSWNNKAWSIWYTLYACGCLWSWIIRSILHLVLYKTSSIHFVSIKRFLSDICFNYHSSDHSALIVYKNNILKKIWMKFYIIGLILHNIIMWSFWKKNRMMYTSKTLTTGMFLSKFYFWGCFHCFYPHFYLGCLYTIFK